MTICENPVLNLAARRLFSQFFICWSTGSWLGSLQGTRRRGIKVYFSIYL